jgi:predicted SAM-dependent methyltransferase
MKIVLITRDRPELTQQTIETMEKNAADWSRHRLLIVFDGTEEEANKMFPAGSTDEDEIVTGKQMGVGAAKNLGVAMFTEITFMSEDDILMFSDNDMYYLPDWDVRLEQALNGSQATQIGGWKHPYHAVSGWAEHITSDGSEAIGGVDAVTGNCFVIKYRDWLKYGPFDANALGPGQSEDYALSQRILKAEDLIGTLDPPVAIHCGLANCEGKAAVGWEEMAAMAEKQIEENDIKKIWLATPDDGTIQIERAEGFSGLNVGSGQRKFNSAVGWINVDCVSRPPSQVPDVVLDGSKLLEHFGPDTQSMVVLHHVIEHFGCGEADEVLRQCFGVLKPGGSLLVFVPDLRKLAGRWLSGEIDTFTFMVNTYGAYQGEDGDRHKWGYDTEALYKYLKAIPGTGQIKLFDWREIPGADIARDWWILGMEVVKG